MSWQSLRSWYQVTHHPHDDADVGGDDNERMLINNYNPIKSVSLIISCQASSVNKSDEIKLLSSQYNDTENLIISDPGLC